MAYYNDIDTMPIWNYNKILETGDLNYMLSEGKLDIKANDAWMNIRQQVVDRYGLDTSLRLHYENMKRITELKAEFLITKERFLLNEITILERDMEQDMKQEGVRFSEIYMNISKFLGYRFDPKTHSIVEYKEAIILIEKQNKPTRNGKAD
jgi:hypothetical protein